MVAVFNSMTFALKVTPLAVRALSEGAVAVKRFQVRNTFILKLRASHISRVSVLIYSISVGKQQHSGHMLNVHKKKPSCHKLTFLTKRFQIDGKSRMFIRNVSTDSARVT